MANKKENKKNIIQNLEVSAFFYPAKYNEDDYKNLALTVGQFCDMFNGLFFAMKCLCNDNPTDIKYSTFESHLKKIAFIEIDNLYQQIQHDLLNRPEHKGTFLQIINNKIREVEGLLLSIETDRCYNKYKTKKINLQVCSEMYISPYLLSEEKVSENANKGTETYCYCYGNLEIFYNATLMLFNEAKSRINELFSPGTLPKWEKTPRQPFSFKWDPETELPELFNKLKGVLIDNGTTLEQFTAIFTRQGIQDITPVKWIADKTLLAYFIDTAMNKNKFPMATDFWTIANLCFENADNLAKNKQSYLNNKTGKPKNFKQIDTLFNIQ